MDNIISKADYQGHNILGSFKEDRTPLQIITDNFNKGLIDEQTFESAKEQLENLLVKGGVGSGRHKVGDIVTGKTPNGSTFIGKIHRELIGGKRFRVYYDGGGDGVYDDHELEKHTENVKKSDSDLDLIKAKSGEGSRGGHIIGHTKSGKPIYEKNHPSMLDWSEQDHRDAAAHHEKAGNKKNAEVHKKVAGIIADSEAKKKETYDRIAKIGNSIKKSDSDPDFMKGGEGSRGGEVLGHTSSGSPIYKRHQDYADQALEKLKSGENHQTLVDYQGHKQIEHIQPNKGKDKGSYSRYMMAPNKDKSTAIKHNAYLEDHEVHRHLTHAAADREEKSNLKKSNSNYDLMKGGEGSRGGKIIGHTKSGKPIYENRTADHDSYKDFSKQDHKDAADAHYTYYHKKDADGSTVLHGKKSFESHLDQSNKKVFMNNLDWGKTTEERNNNLDKFDSLKTDQEKEDFKISLKFPKK